MCINLPVNTIVRLPHPRSRDSQGQETFLARSADKQTRNYDTECSNHYPSLSTYIYIYIYIYIYNTMSLDIFKGRVLLVKITSEMETKS